MNGRGHNQQFDLEFSSWKNMKDTGFDAVVSRVTLERQWGGDMPRLKTDINARPELTQSEKEHLLWRAGLFAQVPDDEWEKWITTSSRNKDAFSLNSMRAKAGDWKKQRIRDERRIREVGVAGMELYAGDIYKIRELKLGKAAAVITDPPYHLKHVDLWEQLAVFSDAVLENNGWLVAMSGNRHLPDVLSKLSTLRYCWTIALRTPGPGNNIFIAPNIAVNTAWKPILVYSKGSPQAWPDGLGDVITSAASEKTYHDWGQNTDVYKLLVEKFSAPGQLVADPFLGGGTTARAVVLAEKSRRFEGFDIDNAHVEIARGSVAELCETRGALLEKGVA